MIYRNKKTNFSTPAFNFDEVFEMPDNSFGYVPTPAIVAPLEFTIDNNQYKSIGGHMTNIRSKKDIIEKVKNGDDAMLAERELHWQYQLRTFKENGGKAMNLKDDLN